MKLRKNADPKKYGYSGYGIGFHACPQFSFQNVVNFGADDGSSRHTGT